MQINAYLTIYVHSRTTYVRIRTEINIPPSPQQPLKVLAGQLEAEAAGQLQVVEDAVDYGIIGDEGDDAHLLLFVIYYTLWDKFSVILTKPIGR